MKYQDFVNTVGMPCCVMSVEKRPEGGYGDIRIICSNQSYKEVMGPNYYDGMLYYELVPMDTKFEDFCYRAAVLGTRMHAYVETKALGCWTDQTLIPLESTDERFGYCQFIFEFTKRAEADRMADISVENAETVISSCITLMGSEDFEEGVSIVLDLLMEKSGAMGSRIMLIDERNRKALVFCDKLKNEEWRHLAESNKEDVITYDLIKSWENVIGVSNSLLVKNEKEMKELEAVNPTWVASMREAGVKNLVLIPLRHQKKIFGYLYAVNFAEENVVETKELIELMSFFLGTGIANHILMDKLKMMSNTDALTGLNNRHAMKKRMDALGGVPFGIINIDLNGLKTVNDTYGHDVGDRLIIQAGEVLKKVFYSEDIFRTGGDEFIVFATGLTHEIFERKVERLKEAAEKNIDVSFAIGTSWSDGDMDVRTAFCISDESMYADKKAYYDNHPEKRRR